MNIRMQKIPALIIGWLIGSLAAAGILALFGGSADADYWLSVATISVFLLVIVAEFWIRDERPKRRRGLWILALVLLVPALILLFAFEPGLGTLAGSLTLALIITLPYLSGKETGSTPGGKKDRTSLNTT